MSDLAISSKLRENYDPYYQGESEWRALGAIDKVKNIVDLCGSVPHRRILDIGSGEGAILKRLSEIKFAEEIYSIEISKTAVETILRRNIPYVQESRLFDGYHVPHADRQFELAVLSHVLEHVEYPRKLLYEASRVASYVFVEVPLEHTLRLGRDFTFNRVGHINFYSWKTIRRLIQSCGLKILTQAVTNPSLPVYRYSSGNRGIFKYAIKEMLLRGSTTVACGLFTYHCSIVCASAPNGR